MNNYMYVVPPIIGALYLTTLNGFHLSTSLSAKISTTLTVAMYLNRFQASFTCYIVDPVHTLKYVDFFINIWFGLIHYSAFSAAKAM